MTQRPLIPVLKLAGALLICACGMGVLHYTAREEERLEASQAWGEALLVLNATIPEGEEENVIVVDALRLPESSLPETSPLLAELRATPGGNELIEQTGLDRNERVICGEFPEQMLTRALASGRLPVPGKREVLAGDITRFDSFELGEQTFRVVGHLQRGVGALTFSYLLPDHESVWALFGEDGGAVLGWYHPEGEAVFRERDDWFDADAEPEIAGLSTRTSDRIALATIAGLALVVLGGMMAQYLVLKNWVGRWRPFKAVVDEIVQRPSLFWQLHVVLWGIFFAMSILALYHPLANMRLAAYVTQEFTDGSLGYIGAAYASGDIARAAWATFLHNYVVATLLMTILPSLLIPFAGVAKTAVSFGAVAFAMSPIWTGFVGGLVYAGWRHQRYDVLNIVICVLFTVFLLFYDVPTTRYVIPLVAVLMIMASGMMVAAWNRIPRIGHVTRRQVGTILMVVVPLLTILTSLGAVAEQNGTLQKTSIAELGMDWVQENVPPGSAITLWLPMKRATNSVLGWLNTSRGGPDCSIRPPFMTTISSDRAIASSWLWVTWMNVISSSR